MEPHKIFYLKNLKIPVHLQFVKYSDHLTLSTKGHVHRAVHWVVCVCFLPPLFLVCDWQVLSHTLSSSGPIRRSLRGVDFPEAGVSFISMSGNQASSWFMPCIFMFSVTVLIVVLFEEISYSYLLQPHVIQFYCPSQSKITFKQLHFPLMCLQISIY